MKIYRVVLERPHHPDPNARRYVELFLTPEAAQAHIEQLQEAQYLYGLEEDEALWSETLQCEAIDRRMVNCSDV